MGFRDVAVQNAHCLLRTRLSAFLFARSAPHGHGQLALQEAGRCGLNSGGMKWRKEASRLQCGSANDLIPRAEEAETECRGSASAGVHLVSRAYDDGEVVV